MPIAINPVVLVELATNVTFPLPPGDQLPGSTIQVSTNPGNALNRGSDGGLFVPVVLGGNPAISEVTEPAKTIVITDPVQVLTSYTSTREGWIHITASWQWTWTPETQRDDHVFITEVTTKVGTQTKETAIAGFAPGANYRKYTALQYLEVGDVLVVSREVIQTIPEQPLPTLDNFVARVTYL